MSKRSTYDHKKLGRQAWHWVYPEIKSIDVIGFEDGLREAISEKLEELIVLSQGLKDNRDQAFLIISKFTKPGSMSEYFYATLASHEFSEYFVIQKWINYWLALWYKIINQNLPSRLNIPLGHFDQFDLDRAKQKPLEELYGDKLRSSGGRLVGLCPFHQEKTPSFYIFSDNHYHCYGCGEHGDVIAFVQKTQNLTFPEAVRYLL